MLRKACLWLVLSVLLWSAAAAEGVLIFDDTPVVIEAEVYDDVRWDFPVALSDMEPAFVVLANKHMLLSRNFVPEPLVSMKKRKAAKDGSNSNGGVYKTSDSKMQLQETCAGAFLTMSEAALQDGITLYLKSAYRSYQTQNTMYYNRLKKNHGRDDGWVNKPGASDHQTGLGLDVVSRSWRDRAMNADFAKTKEAQWMAAHCQEYGFIIRYPKDKVQITEINYEPWHLRYVGIPAATYIMSNGLCLEEFCEELRAACLRFIEAGGSPSLVQPFLQESAVN